MNSQRTLRKRNAAVFRLLVAGALGCAAGGCQLRGLGLVPPEAPPPPADSLVLRGDSLAAEKPPEPGSPEAKLAGAHELFRRGQYAEAADLFNHVADKKGRYPEAVVVEATFYEAECLRLQGRYPRAADTYTKLMKIAPSNPYREQACQHLFEIANYWLDDTRAEMKEAREVKDGKRWMVTPRLVHFEKSKPLAGQESRALEKLEQVHYVDIKGDMGLGDKALFLCGSVKFFNEDYREADHYFTQLHENYPNSPYAPQAVELGIIAKHLSTGGPDYDGRKAAEARVLIDSALRNYPELAEKKSEFLSKQIYSITMQQAAKDFKMAEFYERTGHPGSAWFYYELVRLRYPNTEYFDRATRAMHGLRAKLEKEKGKGKLPAMSPVGGGGPSAGIVPGQPLEPAQTLPPPRPLPQDRQPPPPPRPLPPDLGR